MTPTTKFIQSQFSLIKPLLDNASLDTARKSQDAIGKLMARTHRNDITYDDFSLGSLSASIISPKDVLSSGIILYLHGGGYVTGNLTYAKGFGTLLAAECGIKVMCSEYRLAPENTFPSALDDALLAYEHLLTLGYEPWQIVLCGESAGGGLCYSLCVKLKQLGRVQPAGIIAISPWTDLTASGMSYEFNKQNDPIMTKGRLDFFANCYLYGSVSKGKKIYPNTNEDEEEDKRLKSNPLISPLFADLEKMPPSIIFVGGNEIMLDDARLLHNKLLDTGCKSKIIIKENMWHGYVLYYLKENRSDFLEMNKFLKTNIPKQKKLKWMSLDNAAKIFPASRRHNWLNLFRLSATLNEKVDVEVLKSALDVTVRRFPSIAVSVKTGFFWYYLEEIEKAPEIMEEKPYPLSRMAFDDTHKCAFKVIAYENRIAVEFFHALTDGNGGLIFLKTLVAEYIQQKYGVSVPVGNGILDRLEEPSDQELEDSFQKFAGPHSSSRADTDAFKLSGRRDVDGFKTNTTFIIDAEEILKKAKELGVTVTAYTVAMLIVATANVQKKTVRKRKNYKPVKILVPVNLRKLFPSKTLRNFVLYCSPGIDPKLGDFDFEEICQLVYHQMKIMITPKNMASMIAKNVGDERPLPLRMTPLFIKNFVMKLIFDAVGEKKSCFSFSNLGVVNVPEEFSSKVNRLDFVLGVQSCAPYNTSAITYGGKMYLNIIRNIDYPILEQEIYDALKELGITPQVESNIRIKVKK